MKRLSEITESIWSDMQERGTGDTIKKEDEIITNIKDMKPVDLGSDVPFYFADIDLEVNGEFKFTWEEVKGFIQKIEETGWELPAGPKGMQSIFYNGNQPPRFRDDAYEKTGGSRQELAIDIENTAELTATWVPWSTACMAAFSVMAIQSTALVYSFFVFVLPVYYMLRKTFARRKNSWYNKLVHVAENM